MARIGATMYPSCALITGASGVPDPDLLIRTAGEMRISNYLLWQISYAELYVSPVLWPDFNEAELHAAIRSFQQTRKA